MKRLFNWLLLACMLAALLPAGVLAAEETAEPTVAGMYNVSAALTPQTADKAPVTAETQGSYEKFYTGAVRFDVTASGLAAGARYLLLVVKGDRGTAPTDDTIVYIDQAAAGEGGTVTFNAYPSALTRSHYCVYVVGEGKAYDAASPAAEFDYYQPYTLGDVNDDGYIRSNDALFALQMSVGLGTWTDTQRLAADVDENGYVRSNDALYILQKSVGLPTVF